MMKLSAGIILLALGINTFELHYERRALPHCTSSMKSCPVGRTIDTCCVPEHGRMIVAYQWKPKKDNTKLLLHGIWPSKCHDPIAAAVDLMVEKCDKTRNPSSDKDIKNLVTNNAALEKEMLKYWPNAESNNHVKFWNHEFTKHGTCYSLFNKKCNTSTLDYSKDDNDALAYFNLGLKLYNQFNPTNEFNKIKKDTLMKVDDLVAHFTKKDKDSYHIICKSINKKPTNIFQEIRVNLAQDGIGTFAFTPSQFYSNCLKDTTSGKKMVQVKSK